MNPERRCGLRCYAHKRTPTEEKSFTTHLHMWIPMRRFLSWKLKSSKLKSGGGGLRPMPMPIPCHGSTFLTPPAQHSLERTRYFGQFGGTNTRPRAMLVVRSGPVYQCRSPRVNTTWSSCWEVLRLDIARNELRCIHYCPSANCAVLPCRLPDHGWRPSAL